MPKVNLVPMSPDADRRRDPIGAYKQNAALASALMNSEAYPMSSTGTGLAHVGAKMLGGFLARSADQDRRRAEDQAWSPLKALVENDLKGFGSDMPTSPPKQVIVPTPGTGGGPASGDEVRSREEGQRSSGLGQEVFAKLVQRGFSPAAAKGITGRLHIESAGFDPGVIEGRRTGDNGTAFGVAQWRGPRFANLRRFAAEKGGDWRNLDTQLDFLTYEMRTGADKGAARAFAELQQAKNPEEAVAAFMHFERPRGYSPDNPAAGMHYAESVRQALGIPDMPEQGGPQTQFAQEGGPQQGRVPMGLPPLDLSDQQKRIQMGYQLMQDPLTREQGWKMAQEAAREAAIMKRQYAQQEAAFAQQAERLAQQDRQHQERVGLDRQRVDLQRQQLNKPPKPDPEIQRYEYSQRQRARKGLPEQSYDEWAIERRKAGAANQSVNVGGGSDKQIFDTMAESQKTAAAATTGLKSIREARKAVEAGGIFGAGADIRLGMTKVLQFLGYDTGDAIVNTETFRSAIAPQVAALMKATVGSTQISNADREFAEKAASGAISLDERSIKRMLKIMEVAGREAVVMHRKRLDAVYPEGKNFDRERALFGVEDVPEEGGREDVLQPGSPGVTTAPAQPKPDASKTYQPGMGPPVGTIMDGHRFKGGDPNDEKNWEKLK